MSSIGLSLSMSPVPTSGPGIVLPLFSFLNVGEMFTCGESLVSWTYNGDGDSLSIGITNDGVEQGAPVTSTTTLPSSTTSASLTEVTPTSSASAVGPGGAPPVKKRQFGGYGGSYLPIITETIGDGLNPQALNWTWPLVNVTQGWYRLTANIPNTSITSQQSIPFFVANGSSVDCLQGASPTSPLPSSSGSGATSFPSSSSITIPVEDSSSSSHAGAIAGGVVGGIAFLGAVIAALLFWFCRRRRRRRRHPSRRAHAVTTESAVSGFGPSAWRGIGTKRARQSDSVQVLPKHSHSQTSSIAAREALHSPVGSDEELSSAAHEKVVEDGTKAGILNGMEGFVPYTTTPRPVKRVSAPSSINPPPYPSNNRSRGGSQRALSQPELPSNNTSSTAHSAEGQGGHGRRASLAPAPPPIRIGETEHIPMERTPVTPARRKPVPRYDSSDFVSPDVPQSPGVYGSQESARGSRATLDSFHALQHQNSFGNMRPMHAMMPDPPSVPHA